METLQGIDAILQKETVFYVDIELKIEKQF